MKDAQTLFLLFHLGTNRYALEATCIQEILPLIEIAQISQESSNIGVLNYRGAPVSVIDLSELLSGKRTSPRLSTRIILVRPPGADDRLIGLMAERVTTLLRRAKQEFVENEIDSKSASRVGPVLLEAGGVIQWLKLDRIFSSARINLAQPEKTSIRT